MFHTVSLVSSSSVYLPPFFNLSYTRPTVVIPPPLHEHFQLRLAFIFSWLCVKSVGWARDLVISRRSDVEGVSSLSVFVLFCVRFCCLWRERDRKGVGSSVDKVKDAVMDASLSLSRLRDCICIITYICNSHLRVRKGSGKCLIFFSNPKVIWAFNAS